MLLERFTLLGLVLAPSTAALAISTSFSTPTTTLPNTATASPEASTNSVYFLTTKYITIPVVTNAHVTIPAKTIDIAIPTCIHTITPDKNGYVPPGTCGALYDYYPSFTAAIVVAALFGMLTVVHVTQAAVYKKKFCWVIIMGSLWEFASFVARSISTRNQQNVGVELVSSIFVLLAPIWVNAFAYMLLARMIYFFLPSHMVSSIPASVLAIIFVSLDFVSFVIQLTGGSYAGPTAPLAMQMKGVHIYMGGIGLQQFFILIFLGLAIKFHLEMSWLEHQNMAKPEWKRLLFTIYGCLAFITVRIFFRLIEFSGGKTASNPLPFHESYFYALEAVPMIFAILLFNITHPGTILFGKDSEVPSLRQTFGERGRGRSLFCWRRPKSCEDRWKGLKQNCRYDADESCGARINT